MLAQAFGGPGRSARVFLERRKRGQFTKHPKRGHRCETRSERRYGLVRNLFIREHWTVANLPSNRLDTKLRHHDRRGREFVLTRPNGPRYQVAGCEGMRLGNHKRDNLLLLVCTCHPDPHPHPNPEESTTTKSHRIIRPFFSDSECHE